MTPALIIPFHNLLTPLLRFAAKIGDLATPPITPTTDFSVITNQYLPLIERICFSYAGSIAELNDLKQDALINIWQSMPKFKEECTLKSWIYRITLNACVTALRKKRRQIPTTQLTQLYDTILCDDTNRELLADLHESISRLNPIDKAIVTLWLDELSYEEIARIVGISRANVAKRLHFAKKKIKTLIQQQ